MKLSQAIAFALFSTGLVNAADPIKSAYILNGDVFVSRPNHRPLRLTTDDSRKSQLAWSPSGDRIAFVSDAPGALAIVSVLPASGGVARPISFRPSNPGVHIEGMRGVEQLQWIDENRIALAGSVNPSTVEYCMIKIDSGREVDWYATDGFSLAVSPAGEHVAYVSWVPHFQAEADRRPQLCFDHDCGINQTPWRSFPGQERHLEFVGSPVWNRSGSAVAIIAQDLENSRLTLIVRPLGHPASEYPLPQGSPSETVIGNDFDNTNAYRLKWDREAVLVKAGHTYWRLRPGERALTSVGPQAIQGVIDATQASLDAGRAKAEALGATESAFWCKSCPDAETRGSDASKPHTR